MVDEIKVLFDTIQKLHQKHPTRKFTLDGRLVGDIGEIMVEQNYDIILFNSQEKLYDGCSGNKKVQIKASFKDSLTFPCDAVPEYYIGIKINEDGTFKEIYNGPGANIKKLLENRKPPKNNMHIISMSALKKENNKIKKDQKIRRRR